MLATLVPEHAGPSQSRHRPATMSRTTSHGKRYSLGAPERGIRRPCAI